MLRGSLDSTRVFKAAFAIETALISTGELVRTELLNGVLSEGVDCRVFEVVELVMIVGADHEL